MPTRPSAEAALTEARIWAGVSGEWLPENHPDLWNDLPPTERTVVRFYEPDRDLARRAAYWGYELAASDLADLCRLGAALARTEAEAWERDEPHIATRAYADRRYLLGDRLLHWAVPWLDAAGRCHPPERENADRALAALLGLAERLRPAPALSDGTEGLFPPGEDSFGPIEAGRPLPQHLLSVWSGRVVMRATLSSLGGRESTARTVPAEWLTDPAMRGWLAAMYEVSAPRWARVAREHPGSARLWLDLAQRARQTARTLAA